MRKAMTMGIRAFLVLGLAAGAWGCSDEKDARTLRPLLSWELPADETGAADFVLQFGEVPVGGRSSLSVPLANSGATALHLHGAALEPPFSSPLGANRMEIGVGKSSELVVGFAPTRPSQSEVEQIWTLESNEGRPAYRIRLLGVGVAPILSCDPSQVDLGQVVREDTRTVEVVCTNPLDTEVHLASAEFKGSHASSYSLEAEPEGGWIVPKRGEISLSLSFRAATPGRNNSRLVLRDATSQLLANIELRAEAIESALRLEPSGCLDFGYVKEGRSVSRSLLVRNVGTAELQILGSRIHEEGQRQFTARVDVPARLPAGDVEPLEIAVDFHPTEAGRHRTQLEIATSDLRDGTSTVVACVTGIGGGPSLSCEENGVDFGLVAIGAPMKRRIRCSNVDVPRAGVSVDPLVLGELRTGGASFRAMVLDEEGEASGPRPEGYGPGEAFLVEVEFDPTEEGSAEATLVIESNDSASNPGLRLVGEAVRLPPCDFSVRPSDLGFGTVDRGVDVSRSFSILNHQETACLISDLRLAAGSDPAFSIAPIDHVVLEGLARLDVPVRFRPTDYQDEVQAEVVFQISNGERRDQVVRAHGRVAFPCIVAEPRPLDFGRMGVDCNGSDLTLALVNVCGSPISVEAVDLDDSMDADSFALRTRPAELPLALGPSERTELALRIRPARLGALDAAVAVEVSDAEGVEHTFFFPLRGEGAADLHQTESFVQADRTKVDLLIVMENTTASGNYQVPLRSRVQQMIDFAVEQDVDFHIAVISTGVTAGGSCNTATGGIDGGRFLPVEADDSIPPLPRILSRSTPNLVSALERNLSPNNCHGTPAPFEAMLQALSPPLIHEVRDSREGKTGNPAWNDGNAGFLRDDASLAILALSLRADQSLFWQRSPEQYTLALQQVKGATMRPLTRLHAITTPPTQDPTPSCGNPAHRGDRLLTGVEMTGGSWFNICTPASDGAAWDAAIAQLSSLIFSVPANFPLRTLPEGSGPGGAVQPGDLEVYIDGARIPDRDQGIPVWSYDPDANALAFSRMNNPRPGSEISVRYRVACQDD